VSELAANLQQLNAPHPMEPGIRMLAVLPFSHIYGMTCMLNRGIDRRFTMPRPNVMAGYLHNPDATAATLDADGWLRTGDLASVTADGVFTIADRLKELIKYKGYQVAPAELAALLTHDRIADAAVVGVHDADGEEIPKAYVVPQPGAGLDAAEVTTFVAERVAPYKKVRAVEFVDTIPKSPSGKILRKDLRAREGAGSTAPCSAR
jgi:acyl-CoA synthetase (AMP-forming)/AMP-acid ligase II